MGRMRWACLFLAVACVHAVAAIAADPAEPLSARDLKNHALFLMQQNRIDESFARYRDSVRLSGEHDFEVLQQMGVVLLQKGSQSSNPQEFLMTLFGAGISGSERALEILAKGIRQPDPHVQLLALHFIAGFAEDRAIELFNVAMSSEFLSTRMEAAFYMAQRKHPNAVGQIEGLMFRLPPMFKPYFPSFFALIGTRDGTQALRRLIEDVDPQVRIESILSAARLGRDDFLPLLRKRLTHSHVAELESAIFAIGIMKDSTVLPKLHALTESPTESVRLAAAMALLELGDRSRLSVIEELAKQKNLFAIGALGRCEEALGWLEKLAASPDLQVRLNAGLSLLQLRSSLCLPVLRELFLQDARGLAFHPYASVGRTQTAFKAIPSAELRSKDPLTYKYLTVIYYLACHVK